MFGAGDKITGLALETNAFSIKDGTRLMLKANLLSARHELTRFVIETNAFGIRDDPKTQSRATFLVLSADLWKHRTYSLYPRQQVNKLNRTPAISPHAQS